MWGEAEGRMTMPDARHRNTAGGGLFGRAPAWRSVVGPLLALIALAAMLMTMGGVNQAGAMSLADPSNANGTPGNPNAGCNQNGQYLTTTPSANSTGNGANQSGAYDANCIPATPGNGNGNGQQVGQPCAGCVGNADNQNPGVNNGNGQMPNGTDHNAGYECDTNQGVGQTNPAHTGCTATP